MKEFEILDPIGKKMKCKVDNNGIISCIHEDMDRYDKPVVCEISFEEKKEWLGFRGRRKSVSVTGGRECNQLLPHVLEKLQSSSSTGLNLGYGITNESIGLGLKKKHSGI